MRPHTFFFVVAALLSTASFAAPTPAPSALGGLVESHTGAGKQTVNIGGIDFDNRGKPLDSRGVPTVETDGAASAKTTHTGNLKNPSGNPVPVKVNGRIPPAAAGKAIGKFLLKITGGYVLNTGVAVYDLAKELGFTLGRNPDGTLDVDKSDPNVCSVAPCYLYSTGSYNTTSGGPKRSTELAACQAVPNDWPAGLLAGPPIVVGTAPNSVCQWPHNGGGATTRAIEREGIAPKPEVLLQSSQQEFLDAIATKSGWPSSSTLSRALEDAAKVTGEKIQPENLTISGPASTPGATSTTQKPDGSTETSTTTHNHTYGGNTVTTTNTTVINNYNPTTNTTTTTTTTGTPPKAEEQPEYEATDTPLPDQPKLYTPKYPQGPSKVWTDRKADFMGSPLLQLVGGLTPNIPAAACPQFSFSVNLGFVNFGTYSLGPECYVWDFCKIVILVSALFLARALIFGG
ncbi:hypothetical protein SAMN05216350_1218 [Polaromonas sp. YR568]|uniref:hypothetical protein n=1 Tax=Polaromonas sp. YR568 TaxID=1855301 RepID=UPI0008EAA813|nr:hypothetical protein [Polaromonas sp. YR568]SFV04522.1 hypothetical protein SAMN05216350_1218 [Polaromonas sp. YR568]